LAGRGKHNAYLSAEWNYFVTNFKYP
jgi:hypothetical protein